MAEHYNAFISYRHTPHDSKVAEEIQKQLERFKIPKAIQKATGIKKIDRIFRDKEELPITSNLSETIENALNHSDYLIVICSHAMLESIWVQREINFFLKTHTKKQILTVIAEGEPVEVLPEILKYDEMKLLTEDGDMEMVQVPAEPLSCDYRLPFKKARKEELPRLAATLIGCSYDDLRQRQRQYRRQRIIAASTAAGIALTSLAGYFAWTAAQINENYLASLRNQSAYLSSESNRLYENGDRLSAMMLALEALPSEDDDRPIIPEAIDALVRSSYAYQYPGSNARTLDTSYTHKGAVDRYDFDSSNRYMYVQHSLYSVSFWDTEEHIEYFTKTYESALDGLLITPDNNVIVWNWHIVECLDGQTGESLWSYDDMITDVVLHESTNRIAMTHYNIGTTNNSEVQILNANTGEILQSRDCKMMIDETEWTLAPLCFNQQGDVIVLRMSAGFGVHAQVAIWNTETDSLVYLPVDSSCIEHTVFTENNTLLLTTPVDAENTMDGYSFINYIKGEAYHIMGKTRMLIQCIDVNGNVLWKTEHPYSLLYSGTSVDFITYAENNAEIPAIIYSVGNSSRIYDIQTGTMLNEVTTSDTIVCTAQSDVSITYFLRNGKSGTWNYYNIYSELNSTVDEVNMACYSDRLYVCQEDSSQILSYRKKLYDENWEALDAFPSIDETFHLDNGVLIISDTSDDTDSVLITYITSEGIKWQKPLDRNYYNYAYLGANDEFAILTYTGYDKDSNRLCYIEYWNLETGDVQLKDMNNSEITLSSLSYKNGIYLYPNSIWNEEDNTISFQYVKVDENFNILSSFAEIESESTFTINACNKDCTALLLSNYSAEYILLTETECIQICGPLEESNTKYAWSDDSSYIAISTANTIHVFDQNGQSISEISCEGRYPLSMKFHNGDLLVAYENNTLRRYDPATGTYLSETDIHMGTLPNSGEKIWEFGKDELWLIIDDELNIIDTNSWKLKTTVSNCFDFNIENNTLFVIGWDDDMSYAYDKVIGKFKRYTTEELIERAQEQIGSITLTEEQKAQYGIS